MLRPALSLLIAFFFISNFVLTDPPQPPSQKTFIDWNTLPQGRSICTDDDIASQICTQLEVGQGQSFARCQQSGANVQLKFSDVNAPFSGNLVQCYNDTDLVVLAGMDTNGKYSVWAPLSYSSSVYYLKDLFSYEEIRR